MEKRSVGGVDLAFVDRGRGPVLLLVHGFPLDHSMWAAQIEDLSQLCRVIAVDLRGFGQSGPCAGTLTTEQMADDLAALLDALAIARPITLAGLSMGGYVAMAFCREYAARLRALVLCDTRAGCDSPEAAQNRRETAQRILAEGPRVLLEGMIPKLFAPATLRDKPQLVTMVEQMILRADPPAMAAALLGMAERPDSTPLLSQIRCPVLVLVGEHDAISPPAEMRVMAEAIPAGQLVEIPEAGHLCPMEQPEAAGAVLKRFLAALTEPRP